MHLEFDYLSRENIHIKPTSDPHAIKQTLMDLRRSTIILGEGKDAVDLGICYLPRNENPPCLFRTALAPHPKQAYFFINTIDHLSDTAPTSSWALYFNTPSKRDKDVPDFIELPLSWLPNIKDVLEGKTLITLSSEEKLHIQTLLNLQNKDQLSLNLFNRGFDVFFEKNEFPLEERALYLEYIQKNANHSSPSYLGIAEYNERKKQLGFEFSNFSKSSYKQVYRAIAPCSLLASSIEPSIENLGQLLTDFHCAYVRYENKLYFIDKKPTQCTLIIDENEETQQTLTAFDQAVNAYSLPMDKSIKLTSKELKDIKRITLHSFDCKPLIELGLLALYDYCEPHSVFAESRSAIQRAENEIIETLSDFFTMQACLDDIIKHLADYTSEAKARLDSASIEEYSLDLLAKYTDLSTLEATLRTIAQQVDLLILLIKTSLFFQTEIKEAQADILASYKEKITDFFKLKLLMLPANIRKIEDLVQPLFTTSFSDIYYKHPYRQALLLAIGRYTEEFNLLLDTFITGEAPEESSLYKMKEKLQGRVTLQDLNSELFQLHFDELSQSDEQKALALSFETAKNKLVELLQKREVFSKTSRTLIEKIEAIKKEVSPEKTALSETINNFLIKTSRKPMIEITCQVNYKLSTTLHLICDQESVRATLTAQSMTISSEKNCTKKNVLDAFPEEQAAELRKTLLTSSEFDVAINSYSHSELFRMITFSDLSSFSEDQQLYLLNSFINTASNQKETYSDLFHCASSGDHDRAYSVLHLKNCAALTTKLLKKILLANKDILTEIYIENCPNIDDESIKLISNKNLHLTKIILDNLPHLQKIEIKNAKALTQLNIKNCPSLAYIKVRSSCDSFTQEKLDIDECPTLKTVFFKLSCLHSSTRSFCEAVDKDQYSKADEDFKSIISLSELDSVSLIYALGVWGLSENAENPERILNAIRLLLCVTNAYKKFTDPFLSKLETKLSNIPHSDYLYPKMMACIMNMSGNTCLPDAFLEILKNAGNPGSLLFDFRNVNITDYQRQINKMIEYLNSFLLKDGFSANRLFINMLDRCEINIPDEHFFLSNPAKFNEGEPVPFRLLVTLEQRKSIKVICREQIKDMGALELDSLPSPSTPPRERRSPLPLSASQIGLSELEKEYSLEQSKSSSGSSSSSTLSAPPYTVLFPLSQATSIIPTLTPDLIVQKETYSLQ